MKERKKQKERERERECACDVFSVGHFDVLQHQIWHASDAAMLTTSASMFKWIVSFYASRAHISIRVTT